MGDGCVPSHRDECFPEQREQMKELSADAKSTMDKHIFRTLNPTGEMACDHDWTDAYCTNCMESKPEPKGILLSPLQFCAFLWIAMMVGAVLTLWSPLT